MMMPGYCDTGMICTLCFVVLCSGYVVVYYDAVCYDVGRLQWYAMMCYVCTYNVLCYAMV